MHSRAKERAKLLTAIAGVALIVAAVVGISISLMTGMPSGGGISGQVTIQPYTEDSLADMDAKGTFCKSVLSTKVNRKLEKNGYLMLDTKKEYEKYLSEYLDIVQVEPEQVPLVDDCMPPDIRRLFSLQMPTEQGSIWWPPSSMSGTRALKSSSNRQKSILPSSSVKISLTASRPL